MADYDSDPLTSFAFVVEIGGFDCGYFQEVGGLSATINVESIDEGGRNNSKRKLVGQGDMPNLVLKRGFCVGTMLSLLMDFHKTKTRIDGKIKMFSNGGKEMAHWEFKNGIPCKWDGPQLNVGQNAIAIESLEIAHEGFVNSEYKIESIDRMGK
jgi:phage tail-like protein